MAIRYPAEVHEFIRENVKGTTTKDLVRMVNEKFGTEFTVGKMVSYKKRYKLKSETLKGVPKGSPSKEFPEEIGKYIRENYKGIGPKEMTEMLNNVFGTQYTQQQLTSFYKNHNLNSGLNGRFQKGHVPANKGVKGVHSPGCEKGWFPKGNKPHNTLPVGTERIRPGDGYVWIKIAEPNKWRCKHLVVWEKHNGKIPKGKRIIFLDNNKENCSIDNLAMISNDVHLEMMRSQLRSEVSEITEVGISVAQLKVAVAKKRRKR